MGWSCQDLFEQVRHIKITLPLAIASFFVLPACTPGAKPTAPGTYTLDMEEVIEAMQEKWDAHADELSEKDAKRSRAFANTLLDMLKSITATLEVRADKTFEITMKGDRLWVELNGKQVIENARLPGIPSRGRLGLQHHGGKDRAGKWRSPPALVQFRNISIKELR